MGVPAEDGIGLSPVQAPSQPRRQLQSCRPWCSCGGPVQGSAGLFPFRLDVRSEMEGQTDVVAAPVNLVDDVDAARCPVQQHRAAMQGRRVKRAIPVVFCRPSGDIAVIEYLDIAGLHMTRPRERTAFAGLAPATEFGGVMRDRRPEIRAPYVVLAAAESTWVGQDVDARVAYFDRQGIRVGVRGHAAVSVRAAVAPAPDLIFSARAQQRDSCVSKV